MTDWRDDAACKGLPTDWWFPERGGDDTGRLAKSICATCPVAEPCGQYAIDNGIRYGIWGGGAERNRRGRRPNRHGGRTGTTHGTPTGYEYHTTRGETPCWPCKDAYSRWHENHERQPQQWTTVAARLRAVEAKL